jgi:8-oxo-dGTP pyrophosphatase MutT (NUDIX family)
VLDLDPARPPVEPRPAATLLLMRDAPAGVELCVMQRSLQSAFMGGAVVFPGGRVEPHDRPQHWPPDVAARFSGPNDPGSGPGKWWDAEGVTARVAACREALEEVGVVPLVRKAAMPGSISGAELEALRTAAARATDTDALRAALRAAGLALDLDALVPWARWVTPEAEHRRFDARFFLCRAPAGMEGSVDRVEPGQPGGKQEALRTFWATPHALLEGWAHGELSLFPPTHRTLEQLASRPSVDALFALAATHTLEPICPHFVVEAGVPMLTLPGDPLHPIRERRVAGGTRFVMRGDRWVSEG